VITQQLTQDEVNMSGKLIITAPAGYLAELLSVYTELAQRDNVNTDGEVNILPPLPPPVIDE
jgi:hypothetical protein